MACNYNQDSLHQGDEVQVDYSCQRMFRSVNFSFRRETWSKISIQIQREMMRVQQKFRFRNRSSRNSNKTISQISRSPKKYSGGQRTNYQYNSTIILWTLWSGGMISSLEISVSFQLLWLTVNSSIRNLTPICNEIQKRIHMKSTLWNQRILG